MRIWVNIALLLCLIGFIGCAAYQPPNNATLNSVVKNDTQPNITYIASRKSMKYHLPSCEWANKINVKNKFIFQSLEEPEKSGFTVCKTCNPKTGNSLEAKTNEVQSVFSIELKNAIETLNEGLLTCSVSNDPEEIEATLDKVVSVTNLAIAKEENQEIRQILLAARHALADAYILLYTRMYKLDVTDPEVIDVIEPITRKYQLGNVPQYERSSKILDFATACIRLLNEIYTNNIAPKPKKRSSLPLGDNNPTEKIPTWDELVGNTSPTQNTEERIPTWDELISGKVPPQPQPQPKRTYPIGATAICRDGTYSYSTGRGTCSHHGGVAQWLH